MADKLPSNEMEAVKIQMWRKRHRFTIQILALLGAVLAPFAIHWALEAGQNPLAVVFFGVLALAMLITAWIG